MEGVSQPFGTPISTSTNRGLSTIPLGPPVEVVGAWWEAVPANVRPCVTPCDGASFVVRFSFIDARGVGHIATVATRFGEFRARSPGPFFDG